ncbi:MAG: UDP-N-acetylmuramoyl-tripeptide--D-alanyl-D-alanine ligase [Desulfovibrio sp.]|nr:UDP-N-acetylmuramoyl-tripeptide--D-alanyl-D-alanine ligase [Desulfovibrio sp.]
MRLNYNEIAGRLSLDLLPDDRMLTSVATDSRDVVPGALFVCLPGSRVDGHDFAARAEDMGAEAVLASRALPNARVPVLYVADTVKALGQIAACWREAAKARVVGITGTAGKTTLKEILAQVLDVRGKTARNAMNHNNQIGMPCSMLAADGDEDFWVMEAGISREGDMEELASVLRPDLGLILNTGAGHTEGLDKKGVASHKAQLLQYLAPGGFGLVSADYPELVHEAGATGALLRFFSAEGNPAEYLACYDGPAPASDGDGRIPRGRYRLCLDGVWCDIVAPFFGNFGAENSIAAAAAAHLLGLSTEEITEGFARAQLPAQRFCTKRLGQWDIIDDTYNANPLSMRRVLDAAAELAQHKDFVPVLGEMLELGDIAANEHEKLGRYLAALNPAAVLWKGGYAERVHAGLKEGSYNGPWFVVREREDFLPVFAELRRVQRLARDHGGLVLFKGSRGNRLEELCADLCGQLADGKASMGGHALEHKHVL